MRVLVALGVLMGMAVLAPSLPPTRFKEIHPLVVGFGALLRDSDNRAMRRPSFEKRFCDPPTLRSPGPPVSLPIPPKPENLSFSDFQKYLDPASKIKRYKCTNRFLRTSSLPPPLDCWVLDPPITTSPIPIPIPAH